MQSPGAGTVLVMKEWARGGHVDVKPPGLTEDREDAAPGHSVKPVMRMPDPGEADSVRKPGAATVAPVSESCGGCLGGLRAWRQC